MRRLTVIILVVALFAFLLLGTLSLPDFGSYPERTPTLKAISVYYLQNGVAETGALNVVSSIVWNYRGYDTIGEVTILFTTTFGVIAILRKKGDA
jgi:multicomponent Na+:H+ antiporter subunit B